MPILNQISLFKIFFFFYLNLVGKSRKIKWKIEELISIQAIFNLTTYFDYSDVHGQMRNQTNFVYVLTDYNSKYNDKIIITVSNFSYYAESSKYWNIFSSLILE